MTSSLRDRSIVQRRAVRAFVAATALATAAAASAAPLRWTLVDAAFGTGTSSSNSNGGGSTGPVEGGPLSGSFLFDAVTSTYSDFSFLLPSGAVQPSTTGAVDTAGGFVVSEGTATRLDLRFERRSGGGGPGSALETARLLLVFAQPLTAAGGTSALGSSFYAYGRNVGTSTGSFSFNQNFPVTGSVFASGDGVAPPPPPNAVPIGSTLPLAALAGLLALGVGARRAPLAQRQTGSSGRLRAGQRVARS